MSHSPRRPECATPRPSQRAAALEALADGQWHTTNEISDPTPWAVRTMHDVLTEMWRDGLVSFGRGSGKPAEWRIAT